MASPPALAELQDEALLVRLVREIATDLYDIETILKRHDIDEEKWERLKANPRFRALLESEITAWQSALNTHERVKLKAAAMVEDWLVEAHSRLHDNTENLNAKNELAKLVTRIAGMGLTNADVQGSGGEKFQVTINLGADNQLKFEKELPSKVIDVEPNNE